MAQTALKCSFPSRLQANSIVSNKSAASSSHRLQAAPTRAIFANTQGNCSRPSDGGQRNKARGRQAGAFGVGFGPTGTGCMNSAADVQAMMKEFERWMGPNRQPSSGRWMGSNPQESGSAAVMVPVDVLEQANRYTFRADLPGVSRQDTKVQADKKQRTLTIRGSRTAPQRTEDQNMLRHSERRFGNFHRTFQLPEDADVSSIKAAFSEGVLTVSMNRTKAAEPEVRDIAIDDWLDRSAADKA